ncbi:type VI secretion system tube protein TssD [Enterobacter cloacae]|uniref:type VI secretion system tube protein TssD n=1 Tax=Enterobacter cloacae TaxID=550 RepID=UPI0023B7F6B1|nr:type VI secretion system tube protein TssD [Enterobacter cloacae]
MAIPAYLWLKDDGGADIKGSVDIYGREGSIEIIGLNHGVVQPTDKHNGKATSLRVHSPYSFDKEIDASSPYLYKAVSTGQKFKSAEVKFIIEQTSGESFGRSEFRIHGDHKYGPAGFASEGCIILSPSTRRKILRDGGELEVVR